ncbi:hypothetical protein LSP03_39220 [Lysinibacillus sphaericus]|nr:hypothetical protein LSP03_39220 [Lysinibacillus sphaericus]
MRRKTIRIFNIVIIIVLTFIMAQTTDFSNLTTSDYVYLSLYVLIIILFIVNTILEVINKRRDINE